MGQYYKPMLKPKGGRVWKCFKPRDFYNCAKLMEHSYIGNAVTNYVKNLILRTPMRLVWAGDYADDEKGKDTNLYFLFEAKEPKDKSVPKESIESMRYLVNHKKKLYVDYSKVEKDEYGYRIDPMPLLCAEGNGRGGGDYQGSAMNLIGSWARDLISVESEIPNGYTELVPSFREGEESDIIATQRLKGSQSV